MIPDLSVILVTFGTYQTIKYTLATIHAQTIRDRIEVIIIAPTDEATFGLDRTAVNEFSNCRFVGVAETDSLGACCALGFQQAEASFVTQIEDHVFLMPDWAEKVLAVAQANETYAVVGSRFDNANPATLLSQSDFLVSYGEWAAPVDSGVLDLLPGHNSVYRRDVLLAYGDDLPRMLDSQTVLMWDLRSQGHQLYFEADAVLYHMNFSAFEPWLRAVFFAGRILAARRTQGWPTWKRWVYAGGWWLIPLARLWRLRRQMQHTTVYPQIAIVVLAQFFCSAFGELMGYLTGREGGAVRAINRYESDRFRHVNAKDRDIANLNIPPLNLQNQS
jgi:hypothetical protein